MDNIYIIDAVNYLFRSYYAIGPMTNDKGESTGALYGFIRSLQKLMKEKAPEYLVCVFDGPDNKRSRHAIYAEYKMHRKTVPEDLLPQFLWADQFCQLAGIPVLCIEGVEADDTMASVALWARKQGAVSYLCSSDKDLMQLIDGKTFLLHAHKENALVDREKVKELFGVWPEQMLDYLAIVGDASDHIPGMKGLGAKTAAALLSEFGTLDALLAHPEKLSGKKKQEIFYTEKESALMSRQLAALDTQIAIPKEEAFYQLRPPQRERLIDFYHQMKFHSLLKDLDFLERLQEPRIDLHSKHLVDDEESLNSLLEALSQKLEVCMAFATSDQSSMNVELIGAAFAFQSGEAWYVPLNGRLGKERVQQSLRSFFTQAKCSFYGHDVKRDLHVLQNLGIEPRCVCFDTLIASYLLMPQHRHHHLDEVVLEQFKQVKTPLKDFLLEGDVQVAISEVAIGKVSAYFCEMADDIVRLRTVFQKMLEEEKLDRLFHEIELPLISILTKMERMGIYLDEKQLKEQGKTILCELDVLRRHIFHIVGEEFNLNSPKQLSYILFQKLKLKQSADRKTAGSTSADVLEKLVGEHPVVFEILSYRGLEKLRSTYIDALPSAINAKTGRIHCTFNQSVTATGRLSSQDPNLQNIPVRSKEGLAIRSCFKPASPDGFYIGGDYSQIELRLLAHFSEDPELMRAFRSGQDIHTHTASLVYDLPLSMITSEMRSFAKAVNFGIIYGQGSFGLARQLNISTREAAQFIQTYFKRYPGILDYIESCKKKARETGMSETLMGRRRPISEIASKNPALRMAAERLAVNTPLQGSAADLIKMAMIQIDQAIKKENLEGKMILQIHDELIFEVPSSEISKFQTLIKNKMEGVMQLKVPIEVHIEVGKNWAEC